MPGVKSLGAEVLGDGRSTVAATAMAAVVVDTLREVTQTEREGVRKLPRVVKLLHEEERER